MPPDHIEAQRKERKYKISKLFKKAMTMQKLIRMNISDDASKLKSISLRFSSPVYPGDKLTVKTFDTDEKNKFNFEVENQSNIKVIKNGSFEVIG